MNQALPGVSQTRTGKDHNVALSTLPEIRKFTAPPTSVRRRPAAETVKRGP